VNISHLNIPRQFFLSVFAPAKKNYGLTVHITNMVASSINMVAPLVGYSCTASYGCATDDHTNFFEREGSIF
jgi:hypothetical protein